MIDGLAIIAGANTSIGRRIARRLAVEFSSTMLLGVDAADLGDLAGELNSLGCAAAAHSTDLHSPRELRRVVERERTDFGRAAALVCIEADWPAGPANQLDFPDFDAEAIPADCAGQLAGLLLPTLIRQRCGRIILVTPCLGEGELPATAGWACEAGFWASWRNLCRQVGRSRTTINAIAPAQTDAGPALDSLSRQIRNLGLNRVEVMRLLCRCERESGGFYSELLPAICGQLVRREAEFVSGMCFLLPLLAQQAAA